MHYAKVTPCDITSVLNRQVYVLFYVQMSDLNGNSVGLSIYEEQRPLGIADQDTGAQQIEVNR
jgi:hypothetical protein